tara:strand:+ start:371 stop:1789 length:1419 start_codon:yes stop_codon:yes gene_type:complete
LKTIIKDKKALLILLICCLFSRILTTIYYIEDTDSLRFALSITDYDITKLQPHFPGYPIYCFLAKILYFFIKSFAVTFSILGSVAVFCTIYFLLKILKINLESVSGLLLSGIVFFNPLIWLMSNRYMPDLFGLALAISSYYFLSVEKNRKNILIGFLFTGLLAGVRLSYLPILILPFCNSFLTYKNKARLIFIFFLGCIVWLAPLALLTGIENLINAALKQTQGHFADFGGTIITENSWWKRFLMIIRSTWSDGLGGYWIGRSWQTLILSFPMLYVLYFGIKELKVEKKKNIIYLYISFGIVYATWIFFFQNVLHKSRHILPLLVPLFVVLHSGLLFLIKEKNILNTILLIIFFTSTINITTKLILQHKKPNAISSVKNEIVKNGFQCPIASTPLINYYLEQHGLENDFLDIESDTDIHTIKLKGEHELFLIGNFKKQFLSDYNIISDSTYYHNPYVNRMWSEINTYFLEKK